MNIKSWLAQNSYSSGKCIISESTVYSRLGFGFGRLLSSGSFTGTGIWCLDLLSEGFQLLASLCKLVFTWFLRNETVSTVRACECMSFCRFSTPSCVPTTPAFVRHLHVYRLHLHVFDTFMCTDYTCMCTDYTFMCTDYTFMCSTPSCVPTTPSCVRHLHVYRLHLHVFDTFMCSTPSCVPTTPLDKPLT